MCSAFNEEIIRYTTLCLQSVQINLNSEKHKNIRCFLISSIKIRIILNLVLTY